MYIEEYEDFDTEDDENLDITPEWMKNRDYYNTSYE